MLSACFSPPLYILDANTYSVYHISTESIRQHLMGYYNPLVIILSEKKIYKEKNDQKQKKHNSTSLVMQKFRLMRRPVESAVLTIGHQAAPPVHLFIQLIKRLKCRQDSVLPAAEQLIGKS